jgi:hypothetical protein
MNRRVFWVLALFVDARRRMLSTNDVNSLYAETSDGHLVWEWPIGLLLAL